MSFLPHRLNRHPVVVRGLTQRRVVGVLRPVRCGRLLIGAPLSRVFSTIAIAPTFIVLGIALGVFVGGGFLRRHSAAGPIPGCIGSCSGGWRCAIP